MLLKISVCIYSILLLGTHTFNAFAQSAADSLSWDENRKLTWDDFQGKPEEKTIFGARTYTDIKYKLYDSGTGCRIVVRCLFLKKISWKADQNITPYSLQHEQLHFDLSELYARKLRKAFKEYKYSKDSVSYNVAAIYKKICAEKTEFNNQYDKETFHQVDRTRQLIWNNKIYYMLEELKEYASN